MARHSAKAHSEHTRPVQGDTQSRENLDSPTSGSDQTVAQALNLFKTYGTKDATVTALDDVSVTFERGKMTAIMGPSGSGKSTLMHCMAGLDTPTSGQVIVEGLEVSAMNQKQLTNLRREQIGFIFQSFNLVPTLSAEENILLPLQIANKPIDRAWFKQVVRVVGLENRLEHRPSQLSGGQQQRVACARAIMSRPAVIFADEPTGNLDSRSSREVLTFLQQSVKEYGQSIVMVTHDPRAASYADRVLVLADGKVTQDLQSPTYEEILEVFASDGDESGTMGTSAAAELSNDTVLSNDKVTSNDTELSNHTMTSNDTVTPNNTVSANNTDSPNNTVTPNHTVSSGITEPFKTAETEVSL